jgi:hypothetical protein
MKNGFKVFDTDTHVLPAAEVIERHVDPDFRPRLKELEPYRTPMRQSAEYQGALHSYRIQPQFYRRVLGEAAPRPDHSGRDTVWMGAKVPRPGVQDDNAANRVADMDDPHDFAFIEDPDDRKFAALGAAKVPLVTNDHHLLAHRNLIGFDVLTPPALLTRAGETPST